MTNSDILLIHLIKKGDIKAFEQLFRHYYLPLCRYAQCIVGTREAAEEIISDLFYILWRDKATLNIFQSTKSYLYTAVKNGCIQHIRHHRTTEEHLKNIRQEMSVHAATDPEEETENKELQELLDNCLSKMPERCRNIFHMHRTKRLKYAEIASILDISVKTVEADMSKVLKTLRKEVESYQRSRHIKITPKEARYTLSYKRWGNKYYINHVRGDLHFKVKKKKLLTNASDLHIWFEMATCNIDTISTKCLETKERINPHTIFMDIPSNNNSIWNESNIIPREPDLKKSIETFSKSKPNR